MMMLGVTDLDSICSTLSITLGNYKKLHKSESKKVPDPG